MYYKRKEHIIHWLEFQNIFSICFLDLLMCYPHVFMHTSRHLIQFKILDQSDLGAFSYKNYLSFLPASFLATCQRGAALALAAACLGLGSVPMAMCLGLGNMHALSPSPPVANPLVPLPAAPFASAACTWGSLGQKNLLLNSHVTIIVSS